MSKLFLSLFFLSSSLFAKPYEFNVSYGVLLSQFSEIEAERYGQPQFANFRLGEKISDYRYFLEIGKTLGITNFHYTAIAQTYSGLEPIFNPTLFTMDFTTELSTLGFGGGAEKKLSSNYIVGFNSSFGLSFFNVKYQNIFIDSSRAVSYYAKDLYYLIDLNLSKRYDSIIVGMNAGYLFTKSSGLAAEKDYYINNDNYVDIKKDSILRGTLNYSGLLVGLTFIMEW